MGRSAPPSRSRRAIRLVAMFAAVALGFLALPLVGTAAAFPIITGTVSYSPTWVFAGGTTTLSVTGLSCSSGGGTPTVTLYGTGASPGTATITVGGQSVAAILNVKDTPGTGSVDITVPNLAPGTHDVVLTVASGGGIYCTSPSPSTVSAGSIQVIAGTTSTSLDVNPASVAYGTGPTATATVTSTELSEGVDAGSVQFSVGGIPVGDPVDVDGDGQASLELPDDLAVGGPYGVEAAYTGADGWLDSSDDSEFSVVKDDSTTSLDQANYQPFYGQVVNGTVSVEADSSGYVPTGTAEISIGDTVVDTVTLADGVANFELDPMALELEVETDYALEVDYAGDDNVNPSSDTAGLYIDPAPAELTIVDHPGSVAFGAPYEVDVTASGLGVELPDSAVVSLWDTTADVKVGEAALVDDAATISVDAASGTGTRQLRAELDATPWFQITQSQTVEMAVLAADTTTVVSIDDPQPAGEFTDLVATVNVDSPSTAAVDGTVDFYVDDDPVASDVVVVDGVAIAQDLILTSGAHSIVAIFTPTDSDELEGSMDSEAVLVEASESAVTIVDVSPESPSGPTAALTIDAEVAGELDAGLPNGDAQVWIDGELEDVETVVDGQVTFVVDPPSPGSHQIQVRYLGDDYRRSSQSSVDHSVATFESSTQLFIPASTIDYGQQIDMVAFVEGEVDAPEPTGVVEFRLGSAGGPALATAQVIDGRADAVINDLTVGDHDIVAVYEGDGQLGSSVSDPDSIAVTQAGAEIDVWVDPAEVVAGQTTTLNAAVTITGTPYEVGSMSVLDAVSSPVLAAGLPAPKATGQVQFFVDGELVATANLSDGVAVVAHRFMTARTHAVSATYLGSNNVSAAASAAALVAVEAATPDDPNRPDGNSGHNGSSGGANAANTTTPGALAFTGSGTESLLPLGVILVLFGSVVLIARRRPEEELPGRR